MKKILLVLVAIVGTMQAEVVKEEHELTAKKLVAYVRWMRERLVQQDGVIANLEAQLAEKNRQIQDIIAGKVSIKVSVEVTTPDNENTANEVQGDNGSVVVVVVSDNEQVAQEETQDQVVAPVITMQQAPDDVAAQFTTSANEVTPVA